MKSIKTMKKSMMLSTVLMVVLLIVALSTATFAWFSANNTVTATQAKMTAATSSSANLSIGWASQPTTSSISFKDAADMLPAIPENVPNKAASGTIAAEYVATNNSSYAGVTGINIDQGYTNQTADYGTVKSLKVVPNTIASNTIAIQANDAALLTELNSSVANGEIIGGGSSVELYSTIYKTREMIPAGYALKTATQTAGTFVKVSGAGSIKYDYLIVVADGDALEKTFNYVSVADAKAGTYDGAVTTNTALTTAKVGDFIYNMNIVKAQYTVVPLGQPAPAIFVAGGFTSKTITVGVDFATFVTEAGKLPKKKADDSIGYISVDGAKVDPYKCAAEVGDTIWCVKAKITTPAVTKVGDFTLTQSTVDGSGRFMNNGVAPSKSSILEDKDTAKNTFFIKNNSPTGAKDATISLSAAITVNAGDTNILASDVRIAVFAKLPEGSNLNYLGTIASGGGKTSYGSIVKGAHAGDLRQYDAEASLGNVITLGAGKEAQLQFVVWYEGSLLTANKGGQAVNIAFTFNA